MTSSNTLRYISTFFDYFRTPSTFSILFLLLFRSFQPLSIFPDVLHYPQYIDHGRATSSRHFDLIPILSILFSPVLRCYHAILRSLGVFSLFLHSMYIFPSYFLTTIENSSPFVPRPSETPFNLVYTFDLIHFDLQPFYYSFDLQSSL